jgi:hypothetical protein
MDQEVRTILQSVVELFREELKSTEVRLETMVRGEIQQLRQETAERFDAVAQRFDAVEGGMQQLDRSLRGEIQQLRRETAERFDRVETDVRHTNVVVEGLHGEIRLVAEGVANVDEKLDRFRDEVGGQFEEMRSENRSLYGALDVRVRRLEAAGA